MSPFALMNRVVNPVVRALLASPLHRVLSGKHVALTYTGRRTGDRYTLVTFYEDRGDHLAVHAAWPERKVWWRNLTGDGGPVEVLLRGERRTGHAVATWTDGDAVARVRIELDDATG